MAVSYKNFYKKYLQNFKYNVKRLCILHLILVGILYFRLRTGGGGGGGVGLFKRDESYMLIVPKTVAWVQHLFLH